jgi:hypothetical protein
MKFDNFVQINYIPLSQLGCNAFNDIIFCSTCSPLVCRNICERIYSKKIVFGGGNYLSGQKYCRRCEVYMHHNGFFCPCCGMQLRLTPSNRECKEILRKRKASRIETIA